MNHSPSLIYRWIVEAMKTHPAPEMSDDIHDMECDEMWHFLGSKKIGFWKALDRGRYRPVAWVTGRRDMSTFKQRDDKVKYLKNYTFFTDH